MNEPYALRQLLLLVDRGESGTLLPDEAAELRAAIRALYARPAADREIALHRRMTKAVEAAVDDYRALTCQWTEADGTTSEIARRATSAAFGAVRAVVPLHDEPHAPLHDEPQGCLFDAGRMPVEAGARGL
ncbi:hypothetical protein [Streptomyces silvensis]|uniref:Uncharacterized protein n=1 Tax=Streptomyces silvensis TaxID=1765722 RepID=A0A0W7X560_9ACTN|nr:hypothetical protein [Streptomyces silvensis]KUF18012.1 hypothetical protein AT728_20440 [Streptomyces silvensis]